MKRVVFASQNCVLDRSSGAAIATLDALALLSQAGNHCQAFCGAKMDFGEEMVLEETLGELGLPYEVKRVRIGDLRHEAGDLWEENRPSPLPSPTGGEGSCTAKLVFTKKGDVPITIFRNQFTRSDGWEGMRTGLRREAGGLREEFQPSPEPSPKMGEGAFDCSTAYCLPATIDSRRLEASSLKPRVSSLGDEVAPFLAAYDKFLAANEPDMVLTYGGGPVGDALIELAKRRNVPVVFLLHNFAYTDPADFRKVDYVVVPSEFTKEWYWEKLGLHCHVLPNAIDWRRVEAKRGCRLQTSGFRGEAGEGIRLQTSGFREEAEEGLRLEALGLRQENAKSGASRPGTSSAGASPSRPEASRPKPQAFVTFVNPQPAKGLMWFARIAEQLARRRPDMPMLVVEGRARVRSLEQTGIDLSLASNLHCMANTTDPRQFYVVTKVLLVPSLCPESFGLVAAEAMINGIPVLSSNRGALPETMGAPHPDPLPQGERELSRGALLETLGAEGEAEEGIRLQTSGFREETNTNRAERELNHGAVCPRPVPNPLPQAGEGVASIPTAYGLQPTGCAGGLLFDIPAKYTAETTEAPTAEEVEPWVETVIRLWDDSAFYAECSRRASEHAQRWHPDRLGPKYAAFVGSVTHQPGPPLVPRPAP